MAATRGEGSPGREPGGCEGPWGALRGPPQALLPWSCPCPMLAGYSLLPPPVSLLAPPVSATRQLLGAGMWDPSRGGTGLDSVGWWGWDWGPAVLGTLCPPASSCPPTASSCPPAPQGAQCQAQQRVSTGRTQLCPLPCTNGRAPVSPSPSPPAAGVPCPVLPRHPCVPCRSHQPTRCHQGWCPVPGCAHPAAGSRCPWSRGG